MDCFAENVVYTQVDAPFDDKEEEEEEEEEEEMEEGLERLLLDKYREAEKEASAATRGAHDSSEFIGSKLLQVRWSWGLVSRSGIAVRYVRRGC
jgi:hypothetical protein